jgi:hypothetical protein
MTCDMEGCRVRALYLVSWESGTVAVCGRHLTAAAETALGRSGDTVAETGDRPTIDRA